MRSMLLCAAACAILLLAGCKKEPEAKPNLGPSFKEVTESLDASVKTEVAVKQYWEDHEATNVTWEGKVHDVRSTRGGASLEIAVADFPLYDGYNVVAQTGDVSAAGKLEKGQTVKFRGQLFRYKKSRHGAMLIYLNNVRILLDEEEKE